MEITLQNLYAQPRTKQPLHNLRLVVAVLLTLVILMAGTRNQYQDILVIQMEQSNRYSKMLADCLNGGTLFDSISRVAFFCSKPIEVRL